jgi:hypothetical protein
MPLPSGWPICRLRRCPCDVLGALQHLLLDKDGVFDRMLWRRSQP